MNISNNQIKEILSYVNETLNNQNSYNINYIDYEKSILYDFLTKTNFHDIYRLFNLTFNIKKIEEYSDMLNQLKLEETLIIKDENIYNIEQIKNLFQMILNINNFTTLTESIYVFFNLQYLNSDKNIFNIEKLSNHEFVSIEKFCEINKIEIQYYQNIIQYFNKICSYAFYSAIYAIDTLIVMIQLYNKMIDQYNGSIIEFIKIDILNINRFVNLRNSLVNYNGLLSYDNYSYVILGHSYISLNYENSNDKVRRMFMLGENYIENKLVEILLDNAWQFFNSLFYQNYSLFSEHDYYNLFLYTNTYSLIKYSDPNSNFMTSLIKTMDKLSDNTDYLYFYIHMMNSNYQIKNIDYNNINSNIKNYVVQYDPIQCRYFIDFYFNKIDPQYLQDIYEMKENNFHYCNLEKENYPMITINQYTVAIRLIKTSGCTFIKSFNAKIYKLLNTITENNFNYVFNHFNNFQNYNNINLNLLTTLINMNYKYISKKYSQIYDLMDCLVKYYSNDFVKNSEFNELRHMMMSEIIMNFSSTIVYEFLNGNYKNNYKELTRILVNVYNTPTINEYIISIIKKYIKDYTYYVEEQGINKQFYDTIVITIFANIYLKNYVNNYKLIKNSNKNIIQLYFKTLYNSSFMFSYIYNSRTYHLKKLNFNYSKVYLYKYIGEYLVDDYVFFNNYSFRCFGDMVSMYKFYKDRYKWEYFYNIHDVTLVKGYESYNYEINNDSIQNIIMNLYYSNEIKYL